MKKIPKELPEFAEDEIWLTLPAWAGFGAKASEKAPKGDCGIAVGGDAFGAQEVGPEQQAAYRHVLDESTAMRDVVVDAIVKAYPKLASRGHAEMALPKTVTRATLKPLVSLTMIHIHWPSRDGLAYVGYELRPSWDTEHGVGVMTHGKRVVEVGGADMAILGWVAKGDTKKKAKKTPSKKKPAPKKSAPKKKTASKKASKRTTKR
ncbi:hypothetical protein BH09MYX1_BH09MYX1_00670 [soil metagenome]